MRIWVRLTPRRALGVLAGVVIIGLLVAWSGIINIGASSGHWRVTSWALHWAMQSSIRTYALFEPEAPADLDSAAHIRRAAGHFETSCAFCHGSPIEAAPVLARHMTPSPPGLSGSKEKWSARELSRIVKHGVKYTGMPAWPAIERSDEVWAMVAFIRALPDMSPDAYRDLAFGPTVPGDPVLEGCARCHGLDGGSKGGAVPVIGGQNEAYLAASLKAFAEGTRHSGFMQRAVDGLSADDIARLARHYASQRGLDHTPAADGGRGAQLALQGLPSSGIPACKSCHGAADGSNPAYPRLAGQEAAYLATQLRLMQEKARGGTAYAPIMQVIAERLPDDTIDALAAFYAGRKTTEPPSP